MHHNVSHTRPGVWTLLGHSNIAIAMDLYSHVTPTMQADAAAIMEAPIHRRNLTANLTATQVHNDADAGGPTPAFSLSKTVV